MPIRPIVLSFALSVVLATTSLGRGPTPFLACDFQADGGVVRSASSMAARQGVPTEEGDRLDGHMPDELSAAFWIRFDKLPSKGEPTGLFGISADRAGRIEITLYARPGEFQGDYRMRSSDRVSRECWHHVEFTYSRLRRRANLYLDGRFQWENDVLHLPRLRFGDLVFPPTFQGALQDFRLYDMALPSEHLAIAGDVPERCERLGERIEPLSKLTSNPHLTVWLDELGSMAKGYAASPRKVTRAQLSTLERDVGNAEVLAELLCAKGWRTSWKSPVVPFLVRPLSQELLLPHTIPEDKNVAGTMRIAATRGEYENGSALLFALRPVEIRDVAISPLTGPGGHSIPAEEIDVRLVKRWFRSGGAWLSYHGDRRQRNLTPDLLLHDDALLRVDEWRERNELRFDDPDGPRYRDISDPDKGHQVWNGDIPIHDAKTLRPVKIPESGRNLQFLFTVHIPEGTPTGSYRGKITFVGAGTTIDLVVRVLPFDLPDEPAPYHDIAKTYISAISSFPRPTGAALPCQRDYMSTLLRMARSHNLFHLPGIWDSEEMIALSLEAGMIPDKIFGKAGGTQFPGLRYDWRGFYPGLPREELTSEDKRLALPMAIASALPWLRYFRTHFPATAEPYVAFFTESRDFTTQNTKQGELGLVAVALGQKVYSRGYSMNVDFAGPLQDMHISNRLSPEDARGWHAMGAEQLNFSAPYPGSENPETFRRRVGLRMYKAGYDGHQIRDFFGFRDNWNEFARCPGGDGNYRNFSMVYPQRDGYIGKLALEGLREAYDDLRYATRLRQVALANREAKDLSLRREARRQLLWLENLDGETADLEMVRYAVIDRICILQELIEAKKGVLPPAKKAAER